MKNTFKSITEEAGRYGINIRKNRHGYLQFRNVEGAILAWMAFNGGMWTGFTANEEVTGIKRGTKGDVASWCLDWAANGF